MEPISETSITPPATKEISRWKKLIKKYEKCRRPIKRYRVVKKTDLDKLFHRINVKKSIFYVTEGKGTDASTATGREDDLSDHLFDAEKLDQERLHTKAPVYEIPNAFNAPSFEKGPEGLSKTAHVLPKDELKYHFNVRDRIFVPKKQYDQVKGIIDVDEKYFSIGQKRCKKYELPKQNYLTYLRESLRLRLQTGYVFDEIFKINERAEIEKRRLQYIKLKLKNFSVSFDEYLATEHEESMKPLLDYAEEISLTDQKRLLYSKMEYIAAGIRYTIYDLEEPWRKSKLCEDFVLQFFSTLSQASEEVIEEEKSIPLDDMLRNVSFMSVISHSRPRIKMSEINLKNPKYLFEVLSSLEHQCLDYLTLTEVVDKPNMTISAQIEMITRIYSHEATTVNRNISRLSNLVNFLETENKTLEAHVNSILHGLFKETFSGSEEIIGLSEYLRQTYIRCVSNTSTISLSLLKMMNEITRAYTRLILEMDSLPTDRIKKFVKDVRVREERRLAMAKNARRKVREIETLKEQMFRLFRPIVMKRTRKLMQRSMPPTAKKRPPPKPAEMTQEEKDYLYLFTDFCPSSDDPKKYLSEREKC